MNLEGELSTQPLVIKKEYFFIVYKQEQEKASHLLSDSVTEAFIWEVYYNSCHTLEYRHYHVRTWMSGKMPLLRSSNGKGRHNILVLTCLLENLDS